MKDGELYRKRGEPTGARHFTPRAKSLILKQLGFAFLAEPQARLSPERASARKLWKIAKGNSFDSRPSEQQTEDKFHIDPEEMPKETMILLWMAPLWLVPKRSLA